MNSCRRSRSIRSSLNFTCSQILAKQRLVLPTLLFFASASAHSEILATVNVTCSGDSNAQVAIRWGHPHYDENEPVKLWKVTCDNTQQSKTYPLATRDSQFEVQTEGGIQTGYQIGVTIPGKNGESLITINHASSPSERLGPLAKGSIKRSAGPNKYGEQNFRVSLPVGVTPNVKISMNGHNPTKTGQVALRWGHPNYNDNNKDFFGIWKLPVAGTIDAFGPGLEPKFVSIKDTNSEFEIQTEGGVETSYHIAMWFDFTGSGFGDPSSPDVDIIHGDSPPLVNFSGPVTFKPTKGNIYGELDVGVVDPDLP